MDKRIPCMWHCDIDILNPLQYISFTQPPPGLYLDRLNRAVASCAEAQEEESISWGFLVKRDDVCFSLKWSQNSGLQPACGLMDIDNPSGFLCCFSSVGFWDAKLVHGRLFSTLCFCFVSLLLVCHETRDETPWTSEVSFSMARSISPLHIHLSIVLQHVNLAHCESFIPSCRATGAGRSLRTRATWGRTWNIHCRPRAKLPVESTQYNYRQI